MAERVHGGIDRDELAALDLDAADVIDASVNINPYGPCPAVIGAIRAAPLSGYPNDALARASLADDPATVAVGAGAAELLWTLARVLVGSGASVVPSPTFCEWGEAVRAGGGRVIEVPIDVGAVVAASADARAVYLCNPNNPTGGYLSPGLVAELATALPCPLVVDESFLSLSDHHADAGVALPANAVRVRSLTKDFGIPGVRVGYALAPRDLVAAVDRARPPWTASAAACAAILARDEAWLADTRARILADRDATMSALRAAGLEVPDTAAPYCLVRVGDAARVRRQALARHRVLVRDCSSFDMPEWIRVAARPAVERRRIVDAVIAAAA